MLNNLLAFNYNLYFGLSLSCIIVAVLCAIFVTVVILVQPGNSNGISALGSNAETFYNKDKGQSLESKLKKLTYICVAIIAVAMIAFFLIDVLYH